MVTAKLYAQLGNQCFMVSATICHALRMGVDYAFPKRTTAPQIWRTYFDHFPVLSPKRATQHFYKEPGPEFHPIPDEKDITIEGYFQSELHWYGHKEELQQRLRFPMLQESEFVAVHIRRGDYLRFPDEFPVLPMDYYRQAIEFMKGIGHNHFKIYSDDIKWCMIAFSERNFPDVQITYSTGKDPLSDMKDMYNAKSFITANSTFSLFPALLRTDNPIVVAPAEHRWFGKNAQHLNSKDRVPERFIKL